ncbi:MAG: transposase [Planctomycetia bacterium]|nr:transposase [Planctomycetia bacterium]
MKHFEIEGHAHFLTFSNYRRIPMLSKERTCHWFVDAVAKARVEQEFDVWAWVIMPDHAHMLIWPRRPKYKMGPILQAIKQPIAIRAIGHLRRHAPKFLNKLRVVNKNRTYHRFWQPGGGFDGNQVEPAAIHEIIEYIHNNPVRAGLVEKAIDWKYSSARDWAGFPNVILPVDRTVPTWLNGR